MAYTPEQKQFLAKARQSISDIPASRVKGPAKKVISNDKFVFDAHCHIFDGECVNVLYFALRLLSSVPPALKRWLWKVITGHELTEQKSIQTPGELMEELYRDPTLISDTSMSGFLKNLEVAITEKETEAKNLKGTKGLLEVTKRYMYIVKILRSGQMSDVYTDFKKTYAINRVFNKLNNKKVDQLTIVLGMDLNSGWKGQSKKPYKKQFDELALVAEKHAVLPYLPIDPRRVEDTGKKNLYAYFLEAFNQNDPKFFGVKCYPALGYLPSDARLQPIFEICAEKNIPVMTHCGGEMISTFDNPITLNRNGETEELSLTSRKARARYLNEPREWESVMEKNPKLRLCLGHFGSQRVWEKQNTEQQPRIDTIFNLMRKYEGVYADFSFNLDSPKATNNLFTVLKSNTPQGKVFKERVMFGTDFWVVLPLSDLNSDQRYFLKQSKPLTDKMLKENVLNYTGLNT